MSPQLLADTDILRGVVAGVLLVAFVALWLWCYSARRRPLYDAAAQMPLEEDAHDTSRACCCSKGSRTTADCRGVTP